MEPFSVICTSCQGKLIVKNEKLSGQIVPCPRCQSPVTIPTLRRVLFTPPPGMVADSVAITKGIDDDWADDLDQALAAHRQEPSVPPATRSQISSSSQVIDPLEAPPFAADDEFRLQPLEPQQNPLAPPIPQAAGLFTSGDRVESGEHPPSVVPKKVKPPQPKSKLQQPLVIAFLGLGGLLLAGGLFYLFTIVVRKGKSQGDTVAINGPSDKKPPDIKLPDASVDQPNNPQPANVENDPASPVLPDNPAANDPSKPQEGGLVEGSSPPSSQPSATGVIPPPNTTETLPNTGTLPSMPEKGPEGSPIPPNVKPNPESGQPIQGPEENKTPQVFRDLLGMNRDFASMFSDATPPDAESMKKDTPEIIEIVEATYLTPADRNDPQAALDLPLAKFQLENKSLADLASALTAIGGVGISLDLESIAAIGKSPTTPILVKGDDTTLGELLSQSLEPLGLKYTVESNQKVIYIHATEEAIKGSLPKNWSLATLVDRDQTEAFAEALRRLMPEESTHWKLEGADLVWEPTVAPIIQSRLSVVLDRVRVALKLPPTSGYYADSLVMGLDVEPIVDRLGRRSARENPQRKSISQFIQQSAREREVTIVFDWNGLLQHGLSPSSEKVSLALNRDFQQAVREFEDQYAIEFAVIDRQTLWVTVPEIRRQASQIRVLPLREGETVESLRERFRPLSPVNPKRQSRLVVVEVPGKPFALIRVCPPTMQQIPNLFP